MARGDNNQVVYVAGDVPQLPLQLGQLLVDSSQVSPGITNLQQCTSQSPLVYEAVAGRPEPSGNILNYGADPTGAADSSQAIIDALAENLYVYFPPDSAFRVERTIYVVGNRIITGPNSNTQADQSVTIIDAVPAGATVRSNTATAGTETTITLDAGASAVDDAYNGNLIAITGGTGSGQCLIVADYDGATKVVTVDRAWSTTPDATSTYTLSVASHLFADVAGGFGGVYIGNFAVTGGNGTGSFAIYSTRPQSVIEGIHMEGTSGYNNNGIAIVDGSQSGDGSWETSVRRCKYVAPNAATNYRAYAVAVDGGNVDLERCIGIRGSVGIDVIRCEALRIHKCDMNLQDSGRSSESFTKGQMGIRLGGTGLKKAVKIDSCYLESGSTAVYVDYLEAGSINDTYIDDTGNGGLPQINIVGVNSKNLTIKSCDILSRSLGGKCIQNAGANTTILGNKLTTNGNSTNIPLDNSGTNLVAINNRITGDVAGIALRTTTAMVDQGNTLVSGTLSDTNGGVQYMFPSFGSWTPTLAGSVTPGAHTYSQQQGTYFQIGRRIFADFLITLSAKDAAMAGNALISGLPITSRNSGASLNGVVIASYDNIDLSAGKSQLTSVVNANSTVCGLLECGDNVASASITAAAISSTSGIRGTAIYDF